MTMYNPAFKRSSDDVAARLEQQRAAERSQAQQQSPAYGGGPVPATRPQVRVTVIQVKPGGGPGGQSQVRQRIPQFTPEYYERLAAQHRQTAQTFGNSQYNLQKARGYELRARQMRTLTAEAERRHRGFAPRTKF